MSSALSLKGRDVAVRSLSKDGSLRIIGLHAQKAVTETFQRHDLIRRTYGDKPFLQLVGDNIIFSNMLASTLRDEERVTSRFLSPKAVCLSESLALGETRGMVSNLPSDVSPGALRVDRMLYEHAKAVTSVTVADAADVAEWIGDTSVTDVAASLDESLTLHAANFFRRSEGSEAAVALCTDVNVASTDSEDAESSWSVGMACGYLLQPVVEESCSPRTLAYLAALRRVSARLLRASSNSTSQFGSVIVNRGRTECCFIQDVLSFASGDFEGAFAIAEKCRLPATSIASCVAAIEPLRVMHGLTSHDDGDGWRRGQAAVELDPETVTRTPLDFFCRCNKKDFMLGLRSCSAAQIASAKGQTISCQYCRKQIELTPDEWGELTTVQ